MVGLYSPDSVIKKVQHLKKTLKNEALKTNLFYDLLKLL